MDINIGTLRSLSRQYNEQVNTMISTKENIAKLLPETDMVLNCVKWPKGCKDYLIDRPMLKLMEKGSVIVDISNDEQGASNPSMRPRMRIPATSRKVSYISA